MNGWETIGETIDESAPATDPANLRLFGTADLDKRVSTLDASSYTVGAGQIGETQSVTGDVILVATGRGRREALHPYPDRRKRVFSLRE